MSVVDRENGTFSIRCDDCGKFILMDDLETGKASVDYAMPDSEFSDETIYHRCRQCNESIITEL